MKEIDFTLAPNEGEIIRATRNAAFETYEVVNAAMLAARKDSVEGIAETWKDENRTATHALIAGYILGVRNERKRRRDKRLRN